MTVLRCVRIRSKVLVYRSNLLLGSGNSGHDGEEGDNGELHLEVWELVID